MNSSRIPSSARSLRPLRRLRLAPLVFALLAMATPFQASAEPERPNVVIIFTDDQSWLDLGCYGSPDLATPHLDALAAQGVRFERFYAAAAVCSPSRAGLLTGRWPARAGMPGNASSEKGTGNGLPPEEITLATLFRGAGYATGHVGKWHLGYTQDTMPLAHGFDFSFGHMGGCIDNYSHFFYWRGPNRHDLWRNGERVREDGRYFPDLMVEEASAFMRSVEGRPFILYFAMNLPHYPYQGEPEWLEHYADLPMPRREYAAFISSMDARIGRLLDEIDALGLRESTVVVFQSDHGHSTEERAFFGGGDAGPFRGAKFSFFEGGIRVPAIVSWPGRLPEGETRAQVGHSCDWFPTLAELAGVDLPTDRTIDGRSLVETIQSAEAPSPHAGRALHWETGRGPNAQWAVMRDDWKLVGRSRDTTEGAEDAPVVEGFLANLATDPGETIDHSETQPEIVAELTEQHERYLDE